MGERTLTSMTFFSRSCRVSIWVLRKTWTNLCVGDRRGDGANQHRDGDGGDTHLPALDRPGPSRRGICLIKASEARKASYFLASCECQRDREEATPHLLDQLLVLVELFQVIHAHVLELDLLGAVDVGRVGEDADGHSRARHMRELGGAGETLVALRVAGRRLRRRPQRPSDALVLEADLELDRLDEVPLLCLRLLEDGADLAADGRRLDLRHAGEAKAESSVSGRSSRRFAVSSQANLESRAWLARPQETSAREMRERVARSPKCESAITHGKGCRQREELTSRLPSRSPCRRIT